MLQPMQKRFYQLGLLFLVGLLFSCKEQSAESPVLFFSYPKNNAILWDAATIDLQASVENGDKVTLLLGDSIIGELVTQPYTFNLTVSKIKDGDYFLRATSQRQQKEVRIKISIRNNLLMANVDANQLKAGTRGFLFISDKDGNLVSSIEFKNGDRVKLAAPYSFDNFTLSEAYVSGNNVIEIYSFQEVPRGQWTLIGNNSFPALIGTIGLDFKNISSPYYYISSSGDSEFLYEKNFLDLNISKTPTKIFVREFNNAVNNYKIINDINTNGRQLISLDDVNTPLSIEKITVTGGNNKRGNVILYGFPFGTDFKEYYKLGAFFSKSGVIQLEYPGTSFDLYGSSSFFKDDDITLNSFQLGKKSDLATIKAEVNFKSTSPLTATISTYGDFDMYAATWAYVNEKQNISEYWLIAGPPGRSQNVRLPDLPTEIKMAASRINILDLQFSNILQISKFGISTNYASYIDYISKNGLAAPYAFGKSWKEQVFTKSGNTNGRVNEQPFQSLSERTSVH
jgi:hypothetical protein